MRHSLCSRREEELKEQVKDLQRLLWAIVDSQGGTISIDDRAVLMAKGPTCILEGWEDKLNRKFILRAFHRGDEKDFGS